MRLQCMHVTNLEPQTTTAAVEQLLLRIKQYGYVTLCAPYIVMAQAVIQQQRHT